MIRPTQTGVMFLGISGLVYFASLMSQSSLLLIPVGIVLGCGLINLAVALRAIKGLDVLAPGRMQIAEGEKISQPWTLINRGCRPVACLQIESRGEVVLRAENVPAGSTLNVAPNISFHKRGVHSYARMTVSSALPFGLLKVSRKLDLPGEILVYPAVYPAPPPGAGGFHVMTGGKFKGQRRLPSGINFAGVRPMQSGDSLKQIHWKSSAKGQGMMVKTFEEELSGRVAIIMDAGSSGDLNTLDDCARAVASLALAALDAGDHVEWIALAHTTALLLSPSADGQELLNLLAKLELQQGCLNPERLEKALRSVSRRSAVILVLTEWNEAARQLTRHLQEQRRSLSIYLPSAARVGNQHVTHFCYGAREIYLQGDAVVRAGQEENASAGAREENR